MATSTGSDMKWPSHIICKVQPKGVPRANVAALVAELNTSTAPGKACVCHFRVGRCRHVMPLAVSVQGRMQCDSISTTTLMLYDNNDTHDANLGPQDTTLDQDWQAGGQALHHTRNSRRTGPAYDYYSSATLLMVSQVKVKELLACTPAMRLIWKVRRRQRSRRLMTVAIMRLVTSHTSSAARAAARADAMQLAAGNMHSKHLQQHHRSCHACLSDLFALVRHSACCASPADGSIKDVLVVSSEP